MGVDEQFSDPPIVEEAHGRGKAEAVQLEAEALALSAVREALALRSALMKLGGFLAISANIFGNIFLQPGG